MRGTTWTTVLGGNAVSVIVEVITPTSPLGSVLVGNDFNPYLSGLFHALVPSFLYGLPIFPNAAGPINFVPGSGEVDQYRQTDNTYALFANATYHFTDQLSTISLWTVGLGFTALYLLMMLPVLLVAHVANRLRKSPSQLSAQDGRYVGIGGVLWVIAAAMLIGEAGWAVS